MIVVREFRGLRFNKWFPIAVSAVVIGVIVVLASVIPGAMYYYKLSLDEAIAFMIDPFGSEWSPDYSEVGFKQVRIGDTYAEVLDLCGEPLERGVSSRGVEMWWYTRKRVPGSHWHWRFVYFEDGRVSEITRGFWID